MLPGAKKHMDRVRRMRTGVADVVFRELFVWGDAIRVDAQHSIVHGAIQGKGHIASKPGEPPKRDTGQLDSSITTRADRATLTVEVVADTPYAAALELGRADGSIAERPYMRPASKRQGEKGLARIVHAINVLSAQKGIG